MAPIKGVRLDRWFANQIGEISKLLIEINEQSECHEVANHELTEEQINSVGGSLPVLKEPLVLPDFRSVATFKQMVDDLQAYVDPWSLSPHFVRRLALMMQNPNVDDAAVSRGMDIYITKIIHKE